MIANANRGVPIHMLWTREEDFIGTTYRAMGVARQKAARADGWPMALDVRTSMQQGGFGPDASFDVISRYHVPNYRYSFHTTKFHVPVGTHGAASAGPRDEFYRESFMDELAHRRQGSVSLSARAADPRQSSYKNDMIKALDLAAEMSGWGTPLPAGRRARSASRNEARKATAWRRSAP